MATLSNAGSDPVDSDSWQVGEVALHDAIVAAQAEVVTIGLKRTLAVAGDNGFVAMIRQTARRQLL